MVRAGAAVALQYEAAPATADLAIVEARGLGARSLVACHSPARVSSLSGQGTAPAWVLALAAARPTAPALAVSALPINIYVYMDVIVPPGCGGGSEVQFVDAAGVNRSAVVPEGLVEGDTFHVELEDPCTPPPWLEQILEALTQEKFLAVLNMFLDRECAKFLAAGEADGHTLEQTDVHTSYCRLYESRIEAHLKRYDVSGDEFLAALLQAEVAQPSGESSLSASLLLVQDFRSFASMMKQRALERPG